MGVGLLSPFAVVFAAAGTLAIHRAAFGVQAARVALVPAGLAFVRDRAADGQRVVVAAPAFGQPDQPGKAVVAPPGDPRKPRREIGILHAIDMNQINRLAIGPVMEVFDVCHAEGYRTSWRACQAIISNTDRQPRPLPDCRPGWVPRIAPG